MGGQLWHYATILAIANEVWCTAPVLRAERWYILRTSSVPVPLPVSISMEGEQSAVAGAGRGRHVAYCLLLQQLQLYREGQEEAG